MRPEILNTLFAPAQTLDGIGPRLENRLKKLIEGSLKDGNPRLTDLMWHFPTGLNDRRSRPKLLDAVPGEMATLEVTVTAHQPPPGSNNRIPYRVQCEDETGEIDLIFFRGKQSYLERVLPVGTTRYLSGKVEQFNHRLQMSHPDHIVSKENLDDLPLLEPVYPLTMGLTGKVLKKCMSQVLKVIPELDEWQEPTWLDKRKWPSFHEAVHEVHAPTTINDVLPSGLARRRLAFDELLANQLALALVRNSVIRARGHTLKPTNRLNDAILAVIPFELTSSQKSSLQEIRDDMGSSDRMLRLLQGDVGSGKTIVAVLAMATAIEAGTQAALMAPTEVLARQHFLTISETCENIDLNIALLTGREKGKKRKDILAALESGEIDLLIGTHALFQKDVTFKNLGLAVIDEQHRFGVHQRLALQSKGSAEHADVLVMTATPIPRTLLLTNYGDMEVSKLTDKPPGRKPIETRIVPSNKLDGIISGLKRALAQGTQVYWVCPLVEESEKLDLAAADQRYAYLQEHFGEAVGLVHGRMSGTEKDEVMKAFSGGDISILVATTVIEVGVDVPNATIMVIEHAERFGLSQLHQLRGRVGRGEKQSSCLLLYHGDVSETAKSRLKIIRETEDGFRIAEEDLRLRGGGELLGTRQSGSQAFRVASLPEHNELLVAARDDAKLILHRDPELKSERGKALKTLLYLFERDEAVQLLKAG